MHITGKGAWHVAPMTNQIKNKKHWRQILIYSQKSDLQEITHLNKSMEGSKSKTLPNKTKY